MGQMQQKPSKQDKADEIVSEQPKGTEKTEGLDEGVDDILDEIDGVLEKNAEDFVKSYIQKGGE